MHGDSIFLFGWCRRNVAGQCVAFSVIFWINNSWKRLQDTLSIAIFICPKLRTTGLYPPAFLTESSINIVQSLMFNK